MSFTSKRLQVLGNKIEVRRPEKKSQEKECYEESHVMSSGAHAANVYVTNLNVTLT